MFAIIAHDKARTHGKIASIHGHNARLPGHDEKINIDRERSHLNVALVDPGAHQGSLNGAVRARLRELDITIPKNKPAVMLVQAMVTTSPEYWDDAGGGWGNADCPAKLAVNPDGTWTPKLRNWVDANMKHLRKRWGDANIVGAFVHLDEETPHLHVLIVPAVLGVDKRRKDKSEFWKLNAKGFFGTPKQLSEYIQKDYGRDMAPLGLVPGVPRDEREEPARRTTLKEGRAAAARMAEEAAKALKDAERAQYAIMDRLARTVTDAEDKLRAREKAMAEAEKQQRERHQQEDRQAQAERERLMQQTRQQIEAERMQVIKQAEAEAQKQRERREHDDRQAQAERERMMQQARQQIESERVQVIKQAQAEAENIENQAIEKVLAYIEEARQKVAQAQAQVKQQLEQIGRLFVQMKDWVTMASANPAMRFNFGKELNQAGRIVEDAQVVMMPPRRGGMSR